MQPTEKMEQILFEALTEYSKRNKLVISKIEAGVLSDQFEKVSGLTVTLDDGAMVNIFILDLKE